MVPKQFEVFPERQIRQLIVGLRSFFQESADTLDTLVLKVIQPFPVAQQVFDYFVNF